MEMPKPVDGHARLAVLAGEWEGEEEMMPSPWGPGGKAIGRSSGRVGMDGFFVVQDYAQEREGRTTFRGHGVWGFDPRTNEHCWYWVDSMGMVPASPSRGTWSGDTLTLVSKSEHGLGRYTYRFEGEDTYRFQIENSFDGGASFVTFMTAVYRRK